MSIYSAQGTQTVTATTALTIVSTAAIRPRIIGFACSNVGTVSTDSNIRVQAKRFTAAGTTTAVTPAARDSGDPASVFTAGSNASAEPTYTANTTQKDKGFNPRGTWDWRALEQRDEIILPATAANGVGWLVTTLGGGVTIVVDADVME
ncbi:MAG: hypothetical protein EPN98_21375 [Phenylobacterium sp.]|uniref:hypothetical protein n=1 Tax=Phenylobacterium sp. TaxID=1871053 RepID=UPI0012130978|nr:hypothetical protein [Phenylobacterium sp.]TAL28996.1 MAG: hypothetical protein EPN98_21375 [Phenylobacterium sp.]